MLLGREVVLGGASLHEQTDAVISDLNAGPKGLVALGTASSNFGSRSASSRSPTGARRSRAPARLSDVVSPQARAKEEGTTNAQDPADATSCA